MSHAVAMMMLNGRLDDDIVVPYLDALPAAGYVGVCLHPRDGLAVPYGSDQFWAAIERIVEHARARGLAVWFYDEFSFPSGADGGRIVARYPAARARGLHFRRLVAPEPDALGNVELGPGDLLALLRLRRDGRGVHDVRDVTARCGTHRNRWLSAEMYETDYLCTINVRQVPHERAVTTATVFVYQPESPLEPDEELLAVTVEDLAARHGEAGLPDVAQPEVTDRFLAEVYERYAGLVDTDPVPIFQDEVAYQCDHPWNELIESGLRERWGTQWRTRLAALHEPSGPAWELTRYEYWRVCAGLLERNWFARVARYCAGHGLQMTGHLPGEESFLGHWRLLGDAFRTLAHFDLPGYDVINPPTVDDVHRSQAKGVQLVQSAHWLAGRGPMIAEVFGATGFQHDAEQARTILAWLGGHDILQPIDHSTWTSAASLRKYDAPPVNTRFNPLDVGRADLFAWHEWLRGLLLEYAFDPQVLVLLPQESLARYRLEERELWAGEVSRLETFFHYLQAASVDVVMIPTERLDEIELRPDGLGLNGHTFSALVVPPVASLADWAYRGLDRLAPSGRLLWTVPEPSPAGVAVFGPDEPDGARRPVPAEAVECGEAQLVRERADWFHRRLDLRTGFAHTQRTVVKSVRRRADGAGLLVLTNPHQDELVVEFDRCPGELLDQPATGRLAFDRMGDGWCLRLPPRGVAVVALAPAGGPPAGGPSEAGPSDAGPLQAGLSPVERELLPVTPPTYRVLGANCLRLSVGTLDLTGYERRTFEAGPVSLLWPMRGVRYRPEGVLDRPAHSASALDPALRLMAEFPVELTGGLAGGLAGDPALRVVLDGESAPLGAVVSWDGVELPPRREAVFDPDNTVFVLPADRLGVGVHVLRVTADVRRADDGVLEAPILVGCFAVAATDPRPRLESQSGAAAPWPLGATWPELGLPHGYGPVEYAFEFDVPAEAAGPGWVLALPECVGVAELAVDGVFVGRRSWAPRDVSLDETIGPLTAGRHRVVVTLHGSWNNVFSRLNQVTNGLRGPVRLTLSAQGAHVYASA